MRIWYFLCIYTGFAAGIIKELGTVYLSPNELLELNLHDYFLGNFLDFSIISQNSTNSSLDPFYRIRKNYFYNFEFSDFQVLSVHGFFEYSFVLCVRGLDIYVFYVKLITGECNLILNRTVVTSLKEAEIVQGWIGEVGIILIVNGNDNENQLSGVSVNEIYYTISTLENQIKRIPAWDLRYLKNLKMSLKISQLITFWGSFYGKDIIFLCVFIEDQILVIEDIKSVYLLNSNKPQDLEILDLFTSYNSLVVLQNRTGLLLYSVKHFKIVEFQIIPLNNYGKLKKFSLTNGELVSLAQFVVLTDSGILLIDSESLSIKDFLQFSVGFDTNCQILEPYLFVFEESLSEVKVFRIRETRVYSVFQLNFEKSQRKMMALQDFYGYFIITQNNTRIQFFQMNITEKTLSVYSETYSSVTILAKNSISSINSTLYIKIIEDLYSVYFINNFRNTQDFIVNNYQIYSKVYLDVFDVFSFVSGWNLTVNVNNIVTESIKFNYIEKNYHVLIENKHVVQEYETGYFYYDFYGINQNGVYKNDVLFIDYKYPLNLTMDGTVLEVLYDDFVLFYDVAYNYTRKISYSSNCSSVFKFAKKYTFCVDSQKMLILLRDLQISHFNLMNLTKNEPVIDLTLIFLIFSNLDYIYLLTKSQIFGYLYDQIYMYSFKTLDIEAEFLLSSNEFVYIISTNITVYDKDLVKLQKIIPLPGKPTSVHNDLDILYLQINNSTLIINGLQPVVQSLIGFETLGPCKILPAIFNMMFIYCSDHYYLYESYCHFLCNPIYILNINITNTNLINTGLMSISNPVQLSTKNNIQYLNVSYNLYLYSFLLEFDNTGLENINLLVDYDQNLEFSLSNRFIGFNIDYNLYINGSAVNLVDSPVEFNQRVINNNYFNSTDHTFIDHDYIRNTQIVMVLCADSILFLNVSLEKNFGYTNFLHIISEIPKNEYFKGNVTCLSINYISTKGHLSLFVIYCQESKNDFFYYNGKVTTILTVSNYLLLLEININNLQISSSSKFSIPHYISLLQVITSNSNCFTIACIDSKNSIFSPLSTNNNLYIYKGFWSEDVYIDFQIVINQENFGVSRFKITSIDGIFISNSMCVGPLYLYLTDKLYGLRILKIVDKEIFFQQKIEFRDDNLISVGVCGNSVFVLSELTFIYQYYLDKSHNLVLYIKFPPSYEQSLIGISSVISCSSYYKPRYLAVNFYSIPKSSFELRLIDLETNLLSYYVKNLDYSGVLTSISVRKSLFIDENTVTALGVYLTEFFTYYLSDNEIVLEQMGKSEYKEMVQKWGGNKFEVVLGYKNEFNQKNTSKFYIQRIGPGSDKSYDDKVNYFIFWVIGAISFFLLAIVSFIVYKRIFRKKKQESVELIDIVTPIDRKKRDRMFMFSLNE